MLKKEGIVFYPSLAKEIDFHSQFNIIEYICQLFYLFHRDSIRKFNKQKQTL